MLEKKQHGNLQVLLASSWLAKNLTVILKLSKQHPNFPFYKLLDNVYVVYFNQWMAVQFIYSFCWFFANLLFFYHFELDFDAKRGNTVRNAIVFMSRKGPIVGMGMLDFIEDIFVGDIIPVMCHNKGVLYWPGIKQVTLNSCIKECCIDQQ